MNTVNRFEAGQDARVSSMEKMRTMLEAAACFSSSMPSGRVFAHLSACDHEALSVSTMTLETTEAELMHTVFPRPTLSAMMNESVLDAYGRVIHV